MLDKQDCRFAELLQRKSSLQNIRLLIDGMHCGGCVNRVSTALRNMPGVVVEQVEVGAARVSYDPAQTSPAILTEKVAGLGFKVTKAEPLTVR